MKLTFRTIKGSTFNVEAEPTTTVGELKAAVEASQGAAMPKDKLKLVYKGKILEDVAKAISEYSVDESGFLVVFVQKAEAKPGSAAAGAGGASTSAQPAAAEQVRGGTACVLTATCLSWHQMHTGVCPKKPLFTMAAAVAALLQQLDGWIECSKHILSVQNICIVHWARCTLEGHYTRSCFVASRRYHGDRGGSGWIWLNIFCCSHAQHHLL